MTNLLDRGRGLLRFELVVSEKVADLVLLRLDYLVELFGLIEKVEFLASQLLAVRLERLDGLDELLLLIRALDLELEFLFERIEYR